MHKIDGGRIKPTQKKSWKVRIIIIMGRMGICFTSVAYSSWNRRWSESCSFTSSAAITLTVWTACSLQWRHNERDGVANHRRLVCLPNRLFRRRSNITWKLRFHWPLWGESTGDGWIPLTQGQWHGRLHYDSNFALNWNSLIAWI